MSDRYVVEERPCVAIQGKKQGHDLPKASPITKTCFQVIDTLTSANVGENYDFRDDADVQCKYRNEAAKGISKP